ncbi:pinopsin-like [Homarus americanus]|uniref:pinopsin-like n=1 Tax=Homarus americanus TaxID=6706 RepID=UPI001C45996B|nr:pinopsin-like [Homarus americanus]XP_042231018.1 pinopsin-like [Homarus americanus]XP_042231019.1 pinopsin-like [Homarus americanus]XP_042231020.1 pinopsin-like [Homarus americanus]
MTWCVCHVTLAHPVTSCDIMALEESTGIYNWTMTSSTMPTASVTLDDLTPEEEELMEDPFYNMSASTNSSLTPPYQMVEVGVATELTAVVVLVVGVVGNLMVMVVFLWRPWGRTPLQVDRVVGLLALTGLSATLISVPFHLYSFLAGTYPAQGSLCQVQGFLLNLLCLLCLWYTTVLAVERYVKFASPHEHSLTFSLLNLNVVLSGVLVLLMIEVSGPIYGWAEYGYVPDCGVCVLNPVSTHILTYTVIQTSCYVSLPALLTVCAACCVLHRCNTQPGPLTQGSQVLKSGVGMSVLCGAMLCSVLLMLPYHALLMLQAAQIPVPVWCKVASYWSKIISLACVYPVILLAARPTEVWPPLVSRLHTFKRCRLGGLLHHSDPALDLSSLEVGGIDLSLRKSRRISRSSHATDTTVVSASPSHSTKDTSSSNTTTTTTAPSSVTRV